MSALFTTEKLISLDSVITARLPGRAGQHPGPEKGKADGPSRAGPPGDAAARTLTPMP
jgi:hypothetical protein